jgi:hypothetical protein
MSDSKRSVRVRELHVDGSRLVVLDDRGRVWERLGDMPVGAWGIVELPTETETEMGTIEAASSPPGIAGTLNAKGGP